MPRDLPYPHPTSIAVTAVMKGNRRANTRPEVLLRSRLHRSGLRFRKDLPIRLPGRSARPDIVFRRARVAVFLDGCFWHGCPDHGRRPKVNTGYWGPKLQRNLRRDQATIQELSEAGWTVVRIWEHVPTDEAVQRVLAVVTDRLSAAEARRGPTRRIR